MVKKRVDPRVQGLIESGVKNGHRSLFVLVGDHGKDQVENLHRILSKTRVKSRPSVLWCYKKELGFSTHRQKRMKEIKRQQARGLHDPDRDDPFDLFISSTNIRWTYYKESEKVLGQTFGMCVLQDFEALTPNLLARTIETVEGGGLVILLFKTVKSLKQLYSMSMDVHTRFRTESHHEIVPRFNERFILSLSDCKGCLVLDDELNILPISTGTQFVPSASDPFGSEGNMLENGKDGGNTFGNELDPELVELKASLEETPNVGSIVAKAKTLDQAKAILSFLDAISEKVTRSTVSLTAARGRGKSAALGLCLAGAVGYGYSNIFVTAPSPENLQTTFQMLIVGLKALEFAEHTDFEVVYEHAGNENGKFPVKINIFKDHRQTVQYIKPNNCEALVGAELLAIDEAAAIPLPTVKKLLGPYVTFLSSTVHGYEGTGRALSLKLLSELRSQRGAAMAAAAQSAGAAVGGGARGKKGERKIHESRWKAAAETNAGGAGKALCEITLEEPIRYSSNDPVEYWMNKLLCLDLAAGQTRLVNAMPAPRDCELYCVNRDALFSYHSMSETLLQRIWGLYTSAHYKNSPNDLQMLSDAPAHRLFVLLGPVKKNSEGSAPSIPDVLCVVQIAFEGKISQKSVQAEINKGSKASGDLIPWTLSQQFGDNEFPGLSGARVVRIATHPDVQKMGYGSRAIDLLADYFSGKFGSVVGEVGEGNIGKDYKGKNELNTDGIDLVQEEVKPKETLPPLLITLKERPAERLHWLGTSFGMTSQLLNFWSRKQFRVCYVRQTSNEITGEYSSILLRELDTSGMKNAPVPGWLEAYKHDYRRRLVSLLSFTFATIEAPVALTLVDPDRLFTAVSDQGEGNAKKKASSGLYGASPLTASELTSSFLSHHDLKRLDLYSRNMADHHMIIDTLGTLSKLLFMGRLPSVRLSHLQVAVLVATGLQNRNVDSVAEELKLPVNQVLAFFNKTIRKVVAALSALLEGETAKALPSDATLLRMTKTSSGMNALAGSLMDDQQQGADEYAKKQKQKARDAIMGGPSKDLKKHAGMDSVALEDLSDALGRTSNKTGTISVPLGTEEAARRVEESKAASKESTPGKEKKDKSAKKKRQSSGGNFENTPDVSAGGEEYDKGGSGKKKKHKHSKH